MDAARPVRLFRSVAAETGRVPSRSRPSWDYRLGKRMIAEPLHSHCDGQQIRLLRAADGHNIRNTRLSLGKRSGLVEGDRLKRPQILERRTTLD